MVMIMAMITATTMGTTIPTVTANAEITIQMTTPMASTAMPMAMMKNPIPWSWITVEIIPILLWTRSNTSTKCFRKKQITQMAIGTKRSAM